MRACVFGLLLLSAVFPAALAAQQTASPADWRFAHPSATLVGGIRVSSLVNSPILAAIADESSTQDPQAAMASAMLKNALGKVNEVRFSILDLGNQQMDMLLMVTGQMDERLAAALSQGKVQAHRIDEQTLLIGKVESIDEAVHRMTQPPSLLHNRALVRGSSFTDDDFWLAGNLPDTPMTSQLNVNLRGMALGMRLSGDLVIDLALDTMSQVMAEDLIRLAYQTQAKEPSLGAKLETSVDATTAKFSVTIPQEEALAAIRDRGGKMFSDLAPMMKNGAGAAKAPPPPPKRKTIIIDGLEDGPKEIPVDGAH